MKTQSSQDILDALAADGERAPLVDRSDRAAWISHWTAFDQGETFANAAEVRAYFTATNLVACLGADGTVTDQDELAGWADDVIENRWHMEPGTIEEVAGKTAAELTAAWDAGEDGFDIDITDGWEMIASGQSAESPWPIEIYRRGDEIVFGSQVGDDDDVRRAGRLVTA